MMKSDDFTELTIETYFLYGINKWDSFHLKKIKSVYHTIILMSINNTFRAYLAIYENITLLD